MDHASFDTAASSADDLDGAAATGSGRPGLPTEWLSPPEDMGDDRLLTQGEIDALLGLPAPAPEPDRIAGARAMAGSGPVAYERLPALESAFDETAASLTKSLREFFEDIVEVGVSEVKAVRCGRHLDSVALPTQVALFRVDPWGGRGLLTVSCGLAFATFDCLLGGRRGATASRFDGRPFTRLEVELLRGLVERLLDALQHALQPLAPIRLALERFEPDPRFAALSRATDPAVLVTFAVNLAGRGGEATIVLPYETIAPFRDRLMQAGLGAERTGDGAWQRHLATELCRSEVIVEAILHEALVPLQKVLALEVGSTLMFEARPTDLVTLGCAGWTLAQGRVGRMDDRIAVQVATPLQPPLTSLSALRMTLDGPAGNSGP